MHLVVAGAGALGLAAAVYLAVAWGRLSAAATAPAETAALSFA